MGVRSPRLKMHILDHEYIGKEINALIDEDVEDAGEERREDLPNIPIFRRGFNSALLSGLDMDVLSTRVGVTPHKYGDNEREVALIADAIVVASGAKQAKQIRLVRNGLTPDDKLRAQRRNEGERRKQARAERKAAMEATVAGRAATAQSPQVATPLNSEEMSSAERFDELSNAMCLCVKALFLLVLLVAFVRACGREISGAIGVTIRRATPQTADHVFEDVLRGKIENRLSRREADKVRKRRTRQFAMGTAT
jgi:hypothetical protein